jgi:pyridoxamine 5'-phosphate oxidase
MQPDPLKQFEIWYQEAIAAAARGELKMPDAMSLATATAEGRPSSRMVLYKGLSSGGFTFYTNYGSRKCGELVANPFAALLFYWPGLERQVRIEGPVQKLTSAESDAYWNTRDRESNIGAWASRQSAKVADRARLIARVEELRTRFEGEKLVPRPEFWGGFRLVPSEMEFWVAGEFRLHDRFRYVRDASGAWTQARLSP